MKPPSSMIVYNRHDIWINDHQIDGSFLVEIWAHNAGRHCEKKMKYNSKLNYFETITEAKAKVEELLCHSEKK